MGTFLFNSTIFGPVYSRRLGSSLGINLLPNSKKVCNFNCIYCECGLTGQYTLSETDLPERSVVVNLLENRLTEINRTGEHIDTITFAGNGEPTLHPQFNGIIDDVIELRSKYLPVAKIAVLSNATLIHNKKIFESLLKIDMNILKLDTVVESTQVIINCPSSEYSLKKVIEGLKKFKGNLIIQTMFFRGYYSGSFVDNTTEKQLSLWVDAVKEINPKSVMIYTIARDTPHGGLKKIGEKELQQIAAKIEKLGIETMVSG